MAELTLVSSSQRPLQPLVEGALQNELRLLEAGIRRSEQRLQEFAVRYGLSSVDFIQRFCKLKRIFSRSALLWRRVLWRSPRA
jgi:hypothetical protein